jgi:hypothetical protein
LNPGTALLLLAVHKLRHLSREHADGVVNLL